MCYHKDRCSWSLCVCLSTSGWPVLSRWSLVRRSSRVLVRMLSRSLPLLEPLSTWAFHSLYSSNGEQRRNLKRQRNAVKEQDLIHEIHLSFVMCSFHLCVLVSSVLHPSACETNIKLSPPDWKLYLEDRGERSLSRGAVIEDALVYPLFLSSSIKHPCHTAEIHKPRWEEDLSDVVWVI